MGPGRLGAPSHAVATDSGGAANGMHSGFLSLRHQMFNAKGQSEKYKTFCISAYFNYSINEMLFVSSMPSVLKQTWRTLTHNAWLLRPSTKLPFDSLRPSNLYLLEIVSMYA